MCLEEYLFSVNPDRLTLRKSMVSQQGLLQIVYFMYALVEYLQLWNKIDRFQIFFYVEKKKETFGNDNKNTS